MAPEFGSRFSKKVRHLKRLGYRCGVVSGGLIQVTDWLTAEFGLDSAAANTLEIAERQAHRPDRRRADRSARQGSDAARVRGQAGVPLSQTVAVGDGANDLDMIDAAGLGIAFNAKPAVRSAADTSVSVPFLDAILFLLGIPREDVEAADAADEAAAGARPAGQ